MVAPDPDDVLAPDPDDVLAPDPDDVLAPDPDDVLAPDPDDVLAPDPDDVLAPDPDDVVAPDPDDVVAPVPDDVVAPVPDDVVAPPAFCFSSFFGFLVEDCWPGALGPSSACAAEPLESGSATATAPPAPPISRPAASTKTPAAKRKCDRTTISSPPKGIARQQSIVAALSHGSTIV